MAIKLCHHIKENGIWCKGAALHGRDYCYAHLTFRGRRMRSAQQKRRHAWRLELPLLEDLNAVQIALMQVLDAITEHRLERHDAGQLLYGLQNAASNLRGKDHASFEVSPSAENRCVSYDSFEEDYELTENETAADGSTAAEVPASAEVAFAAVEAQTEAKPSRPPTAAEKKGAATEATENTAPSPIIIDKLMAVAEDYPADLPAGADPALTDGREAPRKPPRGLRPPNAVRQSPEEAAALAKEREATSEECGRLDNGEIMPCKKCEVHVYKRMAQYLEGKKHPDDWLPFSGTMDCLDCQLKHLTTWGRHLDEKMPLMFDIYMTLRQDGGEDPGDFDDYFRTLTECVTRTGKLPEEWSKRLRRWREGDRDCEGDAVDEEGGAEETEASA